MGGGSGGHITPIAAVIDELVKHDSSLEVQLVCDKAFVAQATKVMAELPISVPIAVIPAGKFRRYAHFRFVDYLTTPSVTLHNIRDTFKVFAGVLRSISLLRKERPDVIFAKGGYVCLPVGIAARLLKIPLVIHDSDARPGLTNRLLAPHATKIATGYPVENYPYPTERTMYTGVPIRADFKKVTHPTQGAAKHRLGLDNSSQLIVAVGGGLGAVSINTAMINAAPKLLSFHDSVVLRVVAGVHDAGRVKDLTAQYTPRFITDSFVAGAAFSDLLIAADIVVTRASATTIQELAGLSKAIIAVPSRALGDQAKNAALLDTQHAALVLSDDELAKGKLADSLIELLSNEATRNAYATTLHSLARPHAARDTAALLLQAANKQ